MSNYARLLDTNDLAFGFLVNVLEFSEEEANDLCTRVMKAEKLLLGMQFKSTLESGDHRKPLYKTDDKRLILRQKIFNELINMSRLENDDEIKLGAGGAKPVTCVRCDMVAVIVIGLPASGKSKISSALADKIGAYIIDSDFAKRKLPEYQDEFGASLVHDESSIVTYGGNAKYKDEFNLFEYCTFKKFNIVIPKIGHSSEKIRELRDALSRKGYKVHLVLVSLERVIDL